MNKDAVMAEMEEARLREADAIAPQTPKPINISRARELLKQAMETQGRDFIYSDGRDSHSCYNVPVTKEHFGDSMDYYDSIPEDSPKRVTGCLVGTAMSLSGVMGTWVSHRSGSVDNFWRFLTDDATDYFRVAQVMQDRGHTWGEAFDTAERFIDDLPGGLDYAAATPWPNVVSDVKAL